jgi:hypothetical protein
LANDGEDLAELDPGHSARSRVLTERGVETFESCEVGPGHSYPEPMVRFYGGPYTGWQAVSACLAFGLPIASLRREWDVQDRNEPTGLYWAVTFRERLC